MIGKLQVWRGDRKDGTEKIKIGGFVSIDDLQQPKMPKQSTRKKAPIIFLGRKSFHAKFARDADLFAPDEDQKHNIPLFSNIPGDNPPLSAGIVRSPSTPPNPPPSPVPPITADAARGPKRASTLPQQPQSAMPWSDKPLPLAVDKAPTTPEPKPREENVAFLAVATDPARPASSAGRRPLSVLQGKRNKSETALSRGLSTPSYSLTPSVTPSQSRRASRVTTTKPASPASRHQKSESASTTRTAETTATTKGRAPRKAAPDSCILDEVEGTLSATITELQELQAVAYAQTPQPPSTPSNVDDGSQGGDKESIRSSPSKPEKEARSNEYFSMRPPSRRSDGELAPPAFVPTVPGSQSLPPTPLNATHPRQAPPPDARVEALEQAYDSQKRKAHNLAQENETLKRQISVVLKRIAESDALRNERDKYEHELKKARSKLEARAEELNKSKIANLAAQNKLETVEARLEESNAQKVDVIEANHDLRQSLSGLQKQMAGMSQEVAELRKRPQLSTVTKLSREIDELRKRPEPSVVDAIEQQRRELEERIKHLEEQVKDADGRVDLPSVVADLTFRLDDSQRAVKEKDNHIASLEERNESTLKDMEHLKYSYSKLNELNETLQVAESSHSKLVDVCKTSTAQIADLQAQMAEKEREVKVANAEKDRFQQLLHAEFRRAAVEAHNRQHPSANLLDRRMDLDATIRGLRRRAEEALERNSNPTSASDDPAQQVADLTAELHYHLTDILLYKLDVKGYKKDLRRAQARIQELQAHNQHLTAQLDSAGPNTSGISKPPRDRGPSISSLTSTASTGTSTVPAMSPSATTQDADSPSMSRAVLGVAMPIPVAPGAIKVVSDPSVGGIGGGGGDGDGMAETGVVNIALAIPVRVETPGSSKSRSRERSRSPAVVTNRVNGSGGPDTGGAVGVVAG